eukprot:jgi/Psemu1/310833/fgenesh1_kg.686_\
MTNRHRLARCDRHHPNRTKPAGGNHRWRSDSVRRRSTVPYARCSCIAYRTYEYGAYEQSCEHTTIIDGTSTHDTTHPHLHRRPPCIHLAQPRSEKPFRIP